MRHDYRKEPLSRAIVQEGPKLLEEIIPKDSEEKGRRPVTLLPGSYYEVLQILL